jgi:aquaporin Z
MNGKAFAAEFVGTFALVFIGAGAVALGVGGLVGAAFAHGLVLLVMAAAFGALSGAHINPAVTIGLWLGKQVDNVTAAAYLVVQIVAAVFAAAVLSFVLAGTTESLGQTVLAPTVSPVQGLIVEVILTFFLVNTIYNTAVAGRAGSWAPVAIGLTLTFAILMGGPLTGASLNPARTIGPAIISGDFSNIWLYIIGPIVGGVLAWALYTTVLKDK